MLVFLHISVHVLKSVIIPQTSSRVVWRLSTRSEGPAWQPSLHSLPSLPHDHQVWHDPETPAGTRISELPWHHHPWWKNIRYLHSNLLEVFTFCIQKWFCSFLCVATVKQEFHLDEDNYYTEDEYVEEEEEEEDDDEGLSPEKGTKKKSRGRANGEPRMKMRRIFRITHGRERQRGEAVNENRCSDLQRNFSVYLLFFFFFFCHCSTLKFVSTLSPPPQSKTQTGFWFAIRRSFPPISGWGACLEPSRSTEWTGTPWLPLRPLLSCCWWPSNTDTPHGWSLAETRAHKGDKEICQMSVSFDMS